MFAWASIILAIFSAGLAAFAGIQAHRERLRPDPEHKGLYVIPTDRGSSVLWATLGASATAALSAACTAVQQVTGG